MSLTIRCYTIYATKNYQTLLVTWAPRILGIIFVLFLMMFSLDVFQPGQTWQETTLALLMHNIPALLLGFVVFLSWRHELIGGIVFTAAGLLYILMLAINRKFEWYMLSWSLVIAGPALVTGLLFFKSWRDKQKKHISPKSNAKTPRINMLKRKKDSPMQVKNHPRAG